MVNTHFLYIGYRITQITFFNGNGKSALIVVRKIVNRQLYTSCLCRAVVENAIKPLLFMYHEASSIGVGLESPTFSIFFRFSIINCV